MIIELASMIPTNAAGGFSDVACSRPDADQYDLSMGESQREKPLRPDWRAEFELQTDRRPLEPLPAFLMLMARTLLLWLLVPLGFLGWVLASPWFLRKHVSLGQFLGWLDLNLVAALQRCPLRSLVAEPRPEWAPPSKIAQTEHRIHVLLDLW
jgi:hypothetical protein